MYNDSMQRFLYSSPKKEKPGFGPGFGQIGRTFKSHLRFHDTKGDPTNQGTKVLHNSVVVMVQQYSGSVYPLKGALKEPENAKFKGI